MAAGQFDIAIAASTITAGRQKTVNFSDPYYEPQRAGGAGGLGHRLGRRPRRHDRRRPGRDHREKFANDETDAAEVRGFPEGPDAITALMTGQVDAAIIDQPVAADAVEKQGGIEIVEEIPTKELFGFAIAKDNDALLEAVNGALATIKDDGTIAELYEKYFGGEPPPTVLKGTNELLTERLAEQQRQQLGEGAPPAPLLVA